VELHVDGDVVSWHSHGDILRKVDIGGDISGPNEALRSVTSHEWLCSATLIRFEDIDLSLAASAGLESFWLGEAHSSLDLILGDSSEEDSNVITSFSRVEGLVESLDPCDGGRGVLTLDSDHVDFIVNFGGSLGYAASCDNTSASDSHGAVDRHEEVFVLLSLWDIDVLVHCVY